MRLSSIGDLSHQTLTTRLTAQLRSDLQRLTQEVGTGRRQSSATATTGDLAQVLSLRREMTGLTAYKTAISEVRLITQTAQTVLDRVSKAGSETSVGIVAAGLSRSGPEIDAAASDARVRFVTVVSGLNAQAAGISLFSGIATDRAALAPAEQILAALEAATAGQTTAAGTLTIVESWFHDTGGGFETLAYLGSTAASSFRVGPGETVSYPVTAADPALRQIMFGLTLAALAPQLVDIGERAKLMEAAGGLLIEAGSEVIALRAGLGAVEARIAQKTTQLASEHAALQLAEAEMLSVDPADALTALEATALRLDSLYTITARLSRLTLADYLR